MTGISSRLLSHLKRPPLFLRQLRRHQALTTVTRHRTSLIPANFKTFTTRATTTSDDDHYNSLDRNSYIKYTGDNWQVSHEATWSEWIRLKDCLADGGYFYHVKMDVEEYEDEFAAFEKLGAKFLYGATACLVFATHRTDILRCLSRKDIEVVVDVIYPYLFKSAQETERRMRSFLQAEGSNEATTVDLMKYILNFVNNPIVHSERSVNENTESSVLSLLSEMANLASRSRAPERYEQKPKNLGPKMKRGDWICPKCSFMNFARNTKCLLKCGESRPKIVG